MEFVQVKVEQDPLVNQGKIGSISLKLALICPNLLKTYPFESDTLPNGCTISHPTNVLPLTLVMCYL